MKKLALIGLLTAVLLVTLACSLFGGLANQVANQVVEKAVGGPVPAAASDLWSDVPRMDGLEKASVDLPLAARLAIQTYFKAAAGNDGQIDFISFTTAKKPQDVQNFYTVESMQAAGWNGQDQPGCSTTTSESSTAPVGGFCFFSRQEPGDRTTMLAIVAAEDTNTGKTQVFFARIGITLKPTPAS